MPDKINVVRPDGSVVSATPEEARKLEVLGYKIETPEDATSRIEADVEREYYESGTQRLATGLEGAAAGATLGGFDFIADDEASVKRAQYNPGTRLAGQIVGAVAPALVSGGALTPAGAVSRGAMSIGRGAAEGRVAASAIGAGIEGAVVGAGTEMGRAHLAGDPITAESVLAAAGWGGVYGMGIGATFGVLGRGAEKVAGKIREESLVTKIDDVAGSPPRRIESEVYNPLKSAVDDLARSADDAVKTVDDAMVATRKGVKESERALKVDKVNADALASLKSTEDEILGGMADRSAGKVKATKSLEVTYNKAKRAAEAGDPKGLQTAIDDYRAALREADQLRVGPYATPRDIPDVRISPLQGAAQEAQAAAANAAVKSLEDVSRLRAAAKELRNFPAGPEGFVGMTPVKAERIFGALDTALKSGGPEFDAVRTAVSQAADSLATRAGLTSETGDALMKLKVSWKVLRQSNSKAAISASRKALARDATKSTAGHEKLGFFGSVLSQAAARKASSLSRAAGAGAFLSSAAYQSGRRGIGALLAGATGGVHGLVAEITGVRAAVQNGLRSAAASYVPGIARGARRLAPQAGAIKVRLDGSADEEGGSKKDIFLRRSQEIRDALPAAKDTLFRSVEPLQEAGEGEFAVALHQAATAMIEKLYKAMPKDPGDQFSVGKSFWQPSDVQVLEFERKYNVFQDPVGAMMRVMTTGNIDVQTAEALRDFYPSLYNDLRYEMEQNLADPAFADKLTINDQSNLSALLDISLHACQLPEWIVAQQSMYMEKPEQPKSQGSAGGGSGGRPTSGPLGPPGTTKAQSLTER